jgi:thymidylate synthase ThyX
MKGITSCVGYSEISCGEIASTEDIINICLRHYKQALSKGVKPQEARRIIPQAAYSKIWGAYQPKQYRCFKTFGRI